MADVEKPHFSKRVLGLAESAQAVLGSSPASQALISAVTGSRSP